MLRAERIRVASMTRTGVGSFSADRGGETRGENLGWQQADGLARGTIPSAAPLDPGLDARSTRQRAPDGLHARRRHEPAGGHTRRLRPHGLRGDDTHGNRRISI
jgi:hypothetical protein